MLKRLTFIVVFAAAAYAAYWFWGAHRVQASYEDWFAARAAEGWQAEYSDLAVRGFPSRFDATWTDLALADPETGLAWAAPFFQLFMLSYQPGHVIATWPGTHRLSTPEGRFEITNDSLQASIVTLTTDTLPLQRANLAADTMTIRAPDEGVTALATLRGGIERLEAAQARYRIAASAEGLALSAPVMARLSGSLPDAFRTARIAMTADFDQPWGLGALEVARPQPVALDLEIMEAAWGPMELRVTGQLEIDDAGTPTGEIAIQAREWRAMVDLAVATGALAEGFAPTVTEVLATLAGLSGNSDALDLDLTFRRGTVFVGMLPVGPAPVLRLR